MTEAWILKVPQLMGCVLILIFNVLDPLTNGSTKPPRVFKLYFMKGPSRRSSSQYSGLFKTQRLIFCQQFFVGLLFVLANQFRVSLLNQCSLLTCLCRLSTSSTEFPNASDQSRVASTHLLMV